MLAIWAMEVNKEAISKQGAALVVLRAVKMPFQAAEMGSQGEAPGPGAALWAPISEFRADVAQEAETADDWGSLRKADSRGGCTNRCSGRCSVPNWCRSEGRDQTAGRV